jgi:hypothetical protein
MRGCARLTRYDKIEETKNKRKCVRKFPPKFETQKIPYVKETEIWTVDSSYGSYFIVNGRLKGYIVPGYKNCLKEEAFRKGIILSNKLIEMVFEPIDVEIMEMYKQIIKQKI